MPRKTRILHGEDEYLFVEAPGDTDGPALLIFARPENPRAVAPGRQPTHQSEHGLWAAIARFDGEQLLLAPDPPAGLGDRLKTILPKYVETRRERIAQAKNNCFWVSAGGNALYALHPAQPGGILLKMWRKREDAERALEDSGVPGSVQSTGDLREFLELRAEEGFAGVLLDPDLQNDVIFFLLDGDRRLQSMKVSAPAGSDEAESELLDEAGKWQPYEGAGDLEPLVDAEAWDRLMIRTFDAVPFLGYGPRWRCFTLIEGGGAHGGEPVTVVDPEGDGKQRMLPLFHDPAAADAFRTRHQLGKSKIEPVENLVELVGREAKQGVLARLHPGDHRARGGTFWLRGDDLLLDGFAGIWRSSDGRSFTRSE
jgi:hypothetical protein